MYKKPRTTRDFTDFSGRDYLDTFYAVVNEDNQQILEFLHSAYAKLPKVDRMLEFGGGPCVYQLMSAVQKVSTIVFSDFPKSSLDEVALVLRSEPNAFNWSEYIKYVLQLENKQSTTELVTERMDEIRSKVAKLTHCDVRLSNPLSPLELEPFDLVQMLSVIGAVATTEEEYQSYLLNALSLLKSGGYLVARFVTDSGSWQIGNVKYRTLKVTEETLLKALHNAGLELQEYQVIPKQLGRNHFRMCNILAIKR